MSTGAWIMFVIAAFVTGCGCGFSMPLPPTKKRPEQTRVDSMVPANANGIDWIGTMGDGRRFRGLAGQWFDTSTAKRLTDEDIEEALCTAWTLKGWEALDGAASK